MPVRQFEQHQSKAALHKGRLTSNTQLLTWSHTTAVNLSSKPQLCLQGWWEDACSPQPLSRSLHLSVQPLHRDPSLPKNRSFKSLIMFCTEALAQARRAVEPCGEAWLHPCSSAGMSPGMHSHLLHCCIYCWLPPSGLLQLYTSRH